MSKTEKQECPMPAGILVVIGGREKKSGSPGKQEQQSPVGGEVLQSFVGLTGKQYANIQVVTSGSGEGIEEFEQYRKTFNELGHTAIGHIHHHQRQEVLEDKDLIRRIREADAFFFAGGDQLMLTSLYGGTPFLTELKQRYIDAPIVIGGTSAGAMALSTPMIYAGSEEVQEISGEIKITTGLEFLRDVCVDTHFVHRGRFVRLAQVIATNPTSMGIGIEEDTAIIIRKGEQGEVIGAGTVIIILGFFIAEAAMDNFTEKKPVSVRNLKVDILAPGDTFQLDQRNPPHK
jgi:cyanophycinase